VRVVFRCRIGKDLRCEIEIIVREVENICAIDTRQEHGQADQVVIRHSKDVECTDNKPDRSG